MTQNVIAINFYESYYTPVAFSVRDYCFDWSDVS